MKTGICYIVGAGENYGLDIRPKAGDFVIGVDAGYRFLEEKKIDIDLAIGDFDTLRYIPSHPNVIVLKPEKDDTDMLAAVREGIHAGYERFFIYCGTGGRTEHTIANLQLLADMAEKGKEGFLFDRHSVITAITNTTLKFPGGLSGYVSVFSYTDRSEGVYLEGLKYKLTNAVLRNSYPLGISNEFIGEESSVSVRNGTLLIIFPRGIPLPERWTENNKVDSGYGHEQAADMVQAADVEAIVALLDGCTQAEDSRIQVNVVEGDGKTVSRQYHHGRCDIGSPWACGTAFDVLE